MLMIFGAGPGAALSAVFLSAGLHGAPRQIVLYQGIINAVGGCLLAVLVGIDALAGHLVLMPAPRQVGGTSADILALAYLALMFATLAAGIAVLPVAERLLTWLSPATAEQDLSQPLYLHEEALGDPDSALDLADQEQQRFLTFIIGILDAVRADASPVALADRATLEHAGGELSAAITAFLGDVIDRQPSADSVARVLMLDRRQDHLQALLETTAQLAATAAETRFASRPTALLEAVKESLSVILLSAGDAWQSRDADDLDLLLKLSADRGDLMERLRQRVAGAGADHAETSTLFYVTSLFERAVWLVRQIGIPLAPSEVRDPALAATVPDAATRTHIASEHT